MYFSFLLLFTVHCSLLTAVEAKVYIDITSPAFKKLPIAIQEFSGTFGREISDIIRDDLIFTGLFSYIERAAYIENPSQAVQPEELDSYRGRGCCKRLCSRG